MAGTYGSRDKNLFPIPGATIAETNQYYLIVQADGPRKGEITIKQKTGILGDIFGTDQDKTVGIIPLDNAIRIDTTVATPKELEYFTSAAGQKDVKNKAIETAVSGGLSLTDARQLIRPGTTTTPLLANIPPQEGTGQGSPNDGQSESTPLDPLDINFKIEGQKQRNFNRNLRYPIGKSDQDVIKFTMREYIPLSGLSTKGNKNRQTAGNPPLGTVVLPIQPTIVDNNSVTWQQDTLNPFEVAGLELFSGAVSEGPGGAKGAIDRIIKNLGAEQENAKKGFLAYLAGQAISKNVIARVSGAILNPNIELLFNSPDLRTFNYRFQLSARDKPETDQIRGIIAWFKAGMAVRRTDAELFLVTPNIFDIQYLLKGPGGIDHPYINRIKTCALTNCSVDYTPTGSYMTFAEDGSMVSYSLNLTFQELEPIYQDDYDNLETQIGY